MKMKELSARTGVGREAIRFYLREGLLPEPKRPKKNVARYSEAHVVRIKAIKRLQEERFLPLSVIKALLASGNADRIIDPDAFPDLDLLLHARLDGPVDAPVPIAALQAETGLRDDQVADLDRIGVIHLRQGAKGPYVGGRDAAIARRWATLYAMGFDEQHGFGPDVCRIYVEFVEWLTQEELRLFYSRMGDQLSAEEAAHLGESAITLLNEVIGLMRTRAILRELDKLNTAPQSDDPKPSETGD